jgi:hypothetical protein
MVDGGKRSEVARTGRHREADLRRIYTSRQSRRIGALKLVMQQWSSRSVFLLFLVNRANHEGARGVDPFN